MSGFCHPVGVLMYVVVPCHLVIVWCGPLFPISSVLAFQLDITDLPWFQFGVSVVDDGWWWLGCAASPDTCAFLCNSLPRFVIWSLGFNGFCVWYQFFLGSGFCQCTLHGTGLTRTVPDDLGPTVMPSARGFSNCFFCKFTSLV